MNDEELLKKKQRDELTLRIGRTDAGYNWIRRIKLIGKGDDSLDKHQEEEVRREERHEE